MEQLETSMEPLASRGAALTYEIVTVACGGPGLVLPTDGDVVRTIVNTRNEYSPREMYQMALATCRADIIMYCHDDLTIYDADWRERILNIFGTSPDCVAVGLGGATALGNWDLYRKRYNIWNLARRGYASNQTDAEVHGERFTGDRRVAVIEQFFMAIKVEWLRARDGWPANLTHHGLDMALACEAARDGKELWMAGVSCTHHGGGSSTKSAYEDAKWLIGGSRKLDHEMPHLWIAAEYADVLPIDVCG